ncbi:hypothetical protein FB45DRAFT_998050 [Roridomyces roridus]|uniref:Uncharacterized protein n=1 Tax=Roridomyces roridus TaxID=1738132 RepID=A0AAD7FYG5_9AGAR|nr:hypothetical protein FB45DRAFT_998050 [Roridomyces roridus]
MDLPYELEREIFELAARAYPKDAPSLALVASYVQEWVEAAIYEIIVLGSCCPQKLELFFRTFSSRPTAFFAKNVRVLHLTAGVSHTQARKLLAVCTNLSSLTCWANPLGSGEEFSASLAVTSPNLRRLSINVASLWSPGAPGPNFTHPFLARLTHLELVNPPTWFDWSPLLDGCSLPNLTHLAFGDLTAAHSPTMIDFFVAALASDIPRFEMLIAVSRNVVFLNALEKAELIGPDSGRESERRFVCLPCYYYPFKPSEYWKGVARREVQFWRTPEMV